MTVMLLAALLFTAPWVDTPYEKLLRDDMAAGRWAGMLILPLMLIALASAVHLVRRYRASVGDERLQYRWITLALAINVANIFAFSWTNEIVSTLALTAIPVAFGIAITRYRLYDLDVFVSRSVAYGALAVFIAGVYALIVVGFGSLLGQGDEPNLALSIAATTLIALLFEPVHARLQRFANRLVYGSRATPYAVLSTLTSRLSASETSAAALDRLAEAISNGTGAESASVWIRVGDGLRPEAFWPGSTGLVRPKAPSFDAIEADLVVPVKDAGEELGAIVVDKAASDPVTENDRRLIADVAAGAALLLRNIQLTTQLEERAQQLRASRRRLVAAHDAERHRLERDLHDGAQQQVVALKVKLGIARTLAEREGAEDVGGLAASLADQVQQTVDAMRAVAHGIYPPLLESDGLEAALAAAARSAAIPVDVSTESLGRYSREIEETAFFCVVEAIESGRGSGATSVGIRVFERNGGLAIEMSHDGRTSAAGSEAVTDRVEAFDGTITVQVVEGGVSQATMWLPTLQAAAISS
jgi:signal transduction histidine kinase